MNEAGFSAKDLKEAGFSSAKDLIEAGFSSKELVAAGFSPEDVATAFNKRQMKYKDRKNKKGQRIFCEGKLGTITDTLTNSYGSYCKIQYDDGSKHTVNSGLGGGWLCFANAPGESKDTIPCYAIKETLKEAGLSGEQLFNMLYGGTELIEQHGYSAEELKQGGFPWKLVEGKTAWQMVYKDPANKKGQRVWSEGKLGTITDTYTGRDRGTRDVSYLNVKNKKGTL